MESVKVKRINKMKFYYIVYNSNLVKLKNTQEASKKEEIKKGNIQ